MLQKIAKSLRINIFQEMSNLECGCLNICHALAKGDCCRFEVHKEQLEKHLYNKCMDFKNKD